MTETPEMRKRQINHTLRCPEKFATLRLFVVIKTSNKSELKSRPRAESPYSIYNYNEISGSFTTKDDPQVKLEPMDPTWR